MTKVVFFLIDRQDSRLIYLTVPSNEHFHATSVIGRGQATASASWLMLSGADISDPRVSYVMMARTCVPTIRIAPNRHGAVPRECECLSWLCALQAKFEHKGKRKEAENLRHFCKLCGCHLYAWAPVYAEYFYPTAAAIDTDLPEPPERWGHLDDHPCRGV